MHIDLKSNMVVCLFGQDGYAGLQSVASDIATPKPAHSMDAFSFENVTISLRFHLMCTRKR